PRVSAAPLARRLERASDLLASYPFACWFYGDSIGFEGLLAASELIGRERWRAFTTGYLRAWAARDEPRRPDDNTAPGHVLCSLAYGDLLADETTGLYHHFWLERTGRAYGLGWGRGQGWALLGMLDVLELFHSGPRQASDVAAAQRQALSARAVRLAGAMHRFQ